ncbi:MAG: tetraacyldisaccharide 4-kinase, partial [Bacteroidota bacterium]
MLILKYLLSPFALLYKLITGIRNYLYAIGHFKSFSFQVPMVSVGNLTVGGTGKTPHIEYLIKLFSKTHEVAVLSRGYGRKTKGFILADVAASAKTIGDEPMQYFKKFGKLITVAVGENRAY